MDYAVDPKTMRDMEHEAFELGVSPLLLMEQAAHAAVGHLIRLLQGAQGKHVLFLCGGGNNGGDGLATARMFIDMGGTADILLIGMPKTEQCDINLSYLQALEDEVQLVEDALPPLEPGRYHAVVDALFGTGLKNEPEGIYAQAIHAVNRLNVPVVMSIDIPSGMNGESGRISGDFCCVRATNTLSLGYVKQGLYLTPHRDYVGSIDNVPLNLPASCHPTLFDRKSCAAIAHLEDLKHLLPKRSPYSHKAQMGRVLLYAGSMGYAGAAAMAAKAALKAGAGLVTVACPDGVIPILQTLVPNAMCMPISHAIQSPPAHDALLIGCGIGRTAQAYDDMRALIKVSNAPLVLDADALYLLAQSPFPLKPNTVLTPHVGEAAQLLGKTTKEVVDDLLGSAIALQAQHGGTVALKSATTVIYDGKLLSLNVHGCDALAKGGSGDALSGILSALLCAQKPFQAVQAATLWLGLAGEWTAKKQDARAVLTGDVIDALGEIPNQN